VEMTNSMVACKSCYSIGVAQRQKYKLYPKWCGSCKEESEAKKINELVCPKCSSELQYDVAKVVREMHKVQFHKIGGIVHAYYKKCGSGKLTVVDIHDHSGYIENDTVFRKRNKVMECKVVEIRKVRILLQHLSDVS